MQPGDVIVVRSKTIVGRIIRWATHSWASHVAVYIGDGLVFEARPLGARAVPLSRYQEYRIYRPQIAPDTLRIFLAALARKEGRGYDYGQIVSIAVDRLFGIKLKAQNRRLAICSEIIYEAAKEAGIDLPRVNQAYITPGDFENWPIFKRVEG